MLTAPFLVVLATLLGLEVSCLPYHPLHEFFSSQPHLSHLLARQVTPSTAAPIHHSAADSSNGSGGHNHRKAHCTCMNPFLGTGYDYAGDAGITCRHVHFCFVSCHADCTDLKRDEGSYHCHSHLACRRPVEDEEDEEEEAEAEELK